MDTRRACRILASLFAAAIAALASTGVKAQEPCTAKRGLIIMVEFPGLPRPPQIDQAFVEQRFRYLDQYVREASYDKFCVEAHFSGWHRMPDPVSRYKISAANLDVDRSRIVKLIQDALNAADKSHDFSRYDYLVVYMGASFSSYGMVGLAGYPGMLGWTHELEIRTRSGQKIPRGVAIFTYQAHVGTLFHDSAHVWAGVTAGKRNLPCLYDHDLQRKYPTIDKGWENALINMGYWDPMSSHFYKRELPPQGPSSWSKLRLGWLPPEKVKTVKPDEPTEILLGPLVDGKSETLAIRIPLTPTRYILIENRQPIGRDSNLPGSGVLIMKADDTVAECRHGSAPVKLVNANPKQKYLTGAAFNLPAPSTYIDRENNIEIRLLEKVELSYRIRIGRPSLKPKK